MSITRQGYKVREFPQPVDVDMGSLLYIVSNPTTNPTDNSLTLEKLYVEFLSRVLSVVNNYYPKRSYMIGNAIDTEFIITHSMGTKRFTWSVYDVQTGEDVYPNLRRVNDNQVQLKFSGEIPTLDQYELILNGA